MNAIQWSVCGPYLKGEIVLNIYICLHLKLKVLICVSFIHHFVILSQPPPSFYHPLFPSPFLCFPPLSLSFSPFPSIKLSRFHFSSTIMTHNETYIIFPADWQMLHFWIPVYDMMKEITCNKMSWLSVKESVAMFVIDRKFVHFEEHFVIGFGFLMLKLII